MVPVFKHAFVLLLVATAALATPASRESNGFSLLYSFCSGGYPCPDGQTPGPVIPDSSGNLYGTTTWGGNVTNTCSLGCGTVFKISPKGIETVLYAFCQQANCTDGIYPRPPLIGDGSGNFYGAAAGGSNGGGLIFRLAADGIETVLYSFCNSNERHCDGGSGPEGVVIDGAGNLYGTTGSGGGSDCGVVFKLDSKGNESVLHSFAGYPGDGCWPSGLFEDKNGNLFGTTSMAGAANYGTAFKITSSGIYSLLYSFCAQAACTDGATPESGLIQGKDRNLYGTTNAGGHNAAGTVFKLTGSGKESLVYSFCRKSGCVDGYGPVAGLLEVGNLLYGTTQEGGTNNHGVVFEISGRKETVLHAFGGADGQYPVAPVIKSKGRIYGSTTGGGAYFYGAVFTIVIPRAVAGADALHPNSWGNARNARR